MRYGWAMALVAIALGSFVVGFSGAMMPGPMLAATVAASVRNGRWAGMWIVAGHGVLELGLLALLACGLGPLLQGPGSRMLIGAVGGVALVLMGGDMLRALPRVHMPAKDPGADTPSRARWGPFAAGCVTTLSNPYWYLWWATVGLSLTVESQRSGGVGVASFFGGHILADAVWFGGVGAAVASGRRWMRDRGYRALIGICGAALVLLGGLFVAGAAALLLAT